MFQMRNASYEIDITLMKKLLSDYYHSVNTLDAYEFKYVLSGDTDCEILYGMDIYDEVLKGYGRFFTTRNLHIFSDHKKAMLDRCHFLFNNGYINDQRIINTAEGIYIDFDKILKMYLKFEITKNHSTLDRMTIAIDKVRESEKRLIERLLECL